MGRTRKRETFSCAICGSLFEATVCASGKCKKCRKLPATEAPSCACGCGGLVTWRGTLKGGGWNQYVRGHHLRDKSRDDLIQGFKKGQSPHNKGKRAYSRVCAYEPCSKSFETYKKKKKYCCRVCSSQAKKGVAPWHKGLTKETDERVASLGHSVSASRKEKPTHNKGMTKEDYEPLQRAGEGISVTLKQMYRDGDFEAWNKGIDSSDPRWKATIEKISETKADQFASGTQTFWHKTAKSGWFWNPKTKQEEMFHSAYEACYMHILNEQGVCWTKQHAIKIPYRDEEETQRRYVPDFLIEFDHGKEVHEIKAEWQREEDRNKRKFQAAIRKGWREGFVFKVITEKDFPEFSSFDPSTSEWFVRYTEKTQALIDKAEV